MFKIEDIQLNYVVRLKWIWKLSEMISKMIIRFKNEVTKIQNFEEPLEHPSGSPNCSKQKKENALRIILLKKLKTILVQIYQKCGTTLWRLLSPHQYYCTTSGKPSTWFPPEELIDQDFRNKKFWEKQKFELRHLILLLLQVYFLLQELILLINTWAPPSDRQREGGVLSTLLTQ